LCSIVSSSLVARFSVIVAEGKYFVSVLWNMADGRDPPPLFNNVDCEQRDDDNEDLFSSAIDVVYCVLLSYSCMIYVPFSCCNKLTKLCICYVTWEMSDADNF
jgi:hypothetical protein